METSSLRTPQRKKSFSIFPSPAGMSLTKISLGGNNLYMTSLFPPKESLGGTGWGREYRKVFFTLQDELLCTAKTKYRNFETNIPRIGISGSQS
jgi:hypothetical protein